jgi:hypothetical protein
MIWLLYIVTENELYGEDMSEGDGYWYLYGNQDGNGHGNEYNDMLQGHELFRDTGGNGSGAGENKIKPQDRNGNGRSYGEYM